MLLSISQKETQIHRKTAKSLMAREFWAHIILKPVLTYKLG